MNHQFVIKYILVLFGTMHDPMNIPVERIFSTKAECESAFHRIRLDPGDQIKHECKRIKEEV